MSRFARGLSYYTGIVIECYLKGSSVKLCVRRGRYDNMIGAFLGNKSYPAVGVSFGLDRIYDAMPERAGAAKNKHESFHYSDKYREAEH